MENKDKKSAEYASVEEILAEDLRRRRELEKEFDPVTGRNSVGERFYIRLPDYRIREQYLPRTMSEDPLLEVLESAGSVAGAAAKLGITPQDAADRLTRLRLAHDFPFWAVMTVRIKRKGGGDNISFRLNRPQRRLVEEFEKRRVAGKPIRLIVLKARQWGGSTCAQMYMAWLQLTQRTGLNSLIIAHQGAGSDEIKDMFDRMIATYPTDFLYDSEALAANPMLLRSRKMENVGKSGLIFRVPQRNCKVKIGTAERPDSCRGGDYNLVHLSEVGIWKATDGKSPEDIVRSACGGVLLMPLTMIVYESTANGTGNFFHREYQAAVRGESQFSPLFISWFEIEQYSISQNEEERRRLACRLIAERESDTSSERCESGRYHWQLFKSGATLDAIAWYMAERAKYNEHSRMASEYPSDDVEAFAHSGCRVFDRYDVERMRSDCRAPIRRGEVVSEMPDGAESLRALRFADMENGGMEVWQMPGEGVRYTDRYLAVVDVGGRGAKADWSVITVIDRGPMAEGRRPVISAQWRGHCDTDQLAWRAARIAAFYSEALLVIESNTLETRERDRMVDEGQMPYILLQIKDAYPNLYARRASVEDIREGRPVRLGFHTNAMTKPMVVATLVRCVRENLYEERSEDALDELLRYERRANGSYGAIAGAHDDLLMTRAIGMHIALHEMDMPRPVSERRSGPRDRRRRRPMSEACF